MLIGRKDERLSLMNTLNSNESEFIAVYGRRRVGKTYLINQTFNEHITFRHTGLSNGGKHEQLAEFQESLKRWGLKKVKKIASWQNAFHLLANLLESKTEAKKVVFIDEMPWMDTPQAGFISALEHFWNGWANMRNDIVLVVCGSATSWIVNKIIRDYGGLHNRLTMQIMLKPFTLAECEQFCQYKGLPFTRRDIAEAYMILGGIPYYWNHFVADKSMTQNIDSLFFKETSPLRMEYKALYASLFKNASMHIAIVDALACKTCGLSRIDILKQTKLSDNTAFAKTLEELEQSGFIRKYNAYGKKERGAIYQLMDNYSLFYHRYVKNNVNNDECFWSNNLQSRIYTSWIGLAFERLCLQHITQLKNALGIAGVLSNVFSWQVNATDDHDGAQIDLLIDRSDNVINLCEMKFASDDFVIDKDCDASLRRKVSVFKQVTGTKKSIRLTLITTYGLRANSYSNNVNSVIVLDSLFAN